MDRTQALDWTYLFPRTWCLSPVLMISVGCLPAYMSTKWAEPDLVADDPAHWGWNRWPLTQTFYECILLCEEYNACSQEYRLMGNSIWITRSTTMTGCHSTIKLFGLEVKGTWNTFTFPTRYMQNQAVLSLHFPLLVENSLMSYWGIAAESLVFIALQDNSASIHMRLPYKGVIWCPSGRAVAYRRQQNPPNEGFCCLNEHIPPSRIQTTM